MNLIITKQLASYKWARNNTLQILKAAQAAGVMNFTLHPSQHTALYQFQCLATTDDAYYRKLTNNPDKRFGVLLQHNGAVKKADVPEAQLSKLLRQDLKRLEALLATFTDEQFAIHAQTIQSIFNHEYLHQGQLIVVLRQAGVELPERFRKAFDL